MESQIIVVEQYGHHLRCEEDGLQLLERAVSQRGVEAVADSCHGYRLERTRASSIRDPRGHWSANAGMLPVLAHVAATNGKLLRRKIQEPGLSQLPEPSNLQELAYPSLAAFAVLCERGLIRLSHTFDAAVVIAELRRAFPQQRMVVLGARVGALQTLHERLGEQFGDAECPGGLALVHYRQPLRTHVESDEQYPGLALATFKGAGELDFATSDIVLLLEACECTRDDAQLAFEQVDARFRLYGIVRDGARLAPSETDSLMRVFGPQVIDLQSRGRVRRKTCVEWISVSKPRVELKPDDFRLFSRCYAHNHVRNRRIAQLAKQYLNDSSQPAVTILVEHVEHAIALVNELADWPIVSSDRIDTYGLPGSVRTRLRNGRRQDPGRRQIVLADVANRFPGYESDVVIMASGGPHVASLPASWLFQKESRPRPLRIVDFMDRFNDQARRWSQQRLEEYEKRDMFAPDVSPVMGRINRIQRNESRNEQGGQR